MAEPQEIQNRPEVIIFDCDGVLFDSRKANRAYYDHLLNRFGRPSMNETDLDYVHTHTAGESIAYLFPDPGQREDVLAYNRGLDYSPFILLMELEPGLGDLLQAIRPAIRTAISTNRSTTIQAILKVFQLESFFDLVVSSLDVRRPKPDPESVYKILNHFQVRPGQVLYLGDSEVDAQTARNAGVPFAAYKNPALEADLHFHSFFQLRDYLERTSWTIRKEPIIPAYGMTPYRKGGGER
jgi:phosphoglycolate phosphatase